MAKYIEGSEKIIFNNNLYKERKNTYSIFVEKYQLFTDYVIRSPVLFVHCDINSIYILIDCLTVLKCV